MDDLKTQPSLADSVQDSIVFDAPKNGCAVEVAIRAFNQQSRIITVRELIRYRNECVQQLKRPGRRERKYRSAIGLRLTFRRYLCGAVEIAIGALDKRARPAAVVAARSCVFASGGARTFSAASAKSDAIPGPERDEYRAAFRRGYDSGVQHFMNGAHY